MKFFWILKCCWNSVCLSFFTAIAHGCLGWAYANAVLRLDLQKDGFVPAAGDIGTPTRIRLMVLTLSLGVCCADVFDCLVHIDNGMQIPTTQIFRLQPTFMLFVAKSGRFCSTL